MALLMPVRQGVRIFGGRADSRDCGQLRMLSRDVLIEKVLEGLHHVDGTCVEFLQRKMRKDNRSGYTGVAQTRSGRWSGYRKDAPNLFWSVRSSARTDV